MKLRVGEVIESAIWITGNEPVEMRRQYEIDVTQAIDDLCDEHGLSHSPVKFIEKRPGDERVPPVPDHIQGDKVRLLIAEATVDYPDVCNSVGSFVANLEKKDLDTLRKITRREWAKKYPVDVLSDEQCDDYIEELGPESALDTLRCYRTLQ